MKGVISTTDLDDASLVAKAKASPGLVGRDLVREVLPDQPFEWQEPLSEWTHLKGRGASGEERDESPQPAAPSPQSHVVALDYGMKWNIPRHLIDQGCRVTILPGTATAEEVLAHEPDGVFLSNGPGDPEPLEYAIRTIRGLLGQEARSSASASAISCSAWPAAQERSSSSSATAARIIPCRIWIRAPSRSRRRTTASPLPKIRCLTSCA